MTITTFAPQWIAKMYAGKPGRDHLGLGSVSSDQILPSLSPSINVLTFHALQKKDKDQAELWRGQLVDFRNLYAFLSQVIPYQDSDLERAYVFLRHLASKLPRRSNQAQYDFDNEVRLEYYRLQKISEGSIDLKEGYAQPLDGPIAVGTAIIRETTLKLSQLIDVVNERFGTDFNQADQLFFDQIIEAASVSEELQQAARVNSADKFSLLLNRFLETLFVERMDQNEAIFARYMNDDNFKKVVADWLTREIYTRLSDDKADVMYQKRKTSG